MIFNNHKFQNRVLLAASYLFYSAWNWKFLSLLAAITVLHYVCGLKIYEYTDSRRRKVFLFISIIVSLSILAAFKYFNHFTNLILPLGISFYTFQAMSYSIDIYRKKMSPTRNFPDFALFVAFFPLLLAGPIERARHLLPQILSPRKLTIDKFYEGSFLIFYGLFQKIFVADNLAKLVGPTFNSNPPYNGMMALVSIYAFLFQIYCDFAGYSNIAIGLSRCMGFDIMINFNLPYFTTNPQDFWKRWHISLSSWVFDYVYFPLFFLMRKIRGNFRMYTISIITMVVIGLWHGASWVYIIWGFYHGVILQTYVLLRPKVCDWIHPKNEISRNIWHCTRIAFMLQFLAVGALIFRSRSVKQIFDILHGLIFNFRFSPDIEIAGAFLRIMFYLLPLIAVELLQYIKNDLMIILKLDVYIRIAIYILYFILLIALGAPDGKKFIYFQF